MIKYSELAEKIVSLPPSVGATRLVCIDGRAGSGKTTCALALNDLLPEALVIHMDDLYNGWHETLDVPLASRVVQQIINPITVGQSSRYQQFNWLLNDFDEWREIPSTQVLLLEGVASAHPLIRQHAALSIWIDIDPATGAQRVLARDGEISAGHIEQWQIQEDIYIQEHHTPLKCDLVFSGV